MHKCLRKRVECKLFQRFKKLDTFDETSVKSIEKFINHIGSMSRGEMSDVLMKENFIKAIDCLKQMNKNEFKNDKTLLLLNVLVILSVHLSGNSRDFNTIVLDVNMHYLFKDMLKYYLGISDAEYSDRKMAINDIVLTTGIATESENMSIENLNTGLVELTLYILNNENLLNDIKDIESLSLLHNIICFLNNTAMWFVVKNDLINLNIIDSLMTHKAKIDSLLKQKFSCTKNHKIFQVINMDIVCTLAFLLNEEQLERYNLTNEIIVDLLEIINKAIEQSPHNESIRGTQYYVYFENDFEIFKQIFDYLPCLLYMSFNDKVKTMIYEMNGLKPIIHLLKNSKLPIEQEKSAELLLSLCFNEGIRRVIKNDADLMKLIQFKIIDSNNHVVVKSCKQIVEMVNNTLDKRIDLRQIDTSTLTYDDTQHVLISYCHHDKIICRKLNDILKIKRYKTWIDIDNPFKNMLHDMAEAVECASMVLVCFSEAYKLNSQCRLELEYSLKCKKPIIPIRVQSRYKADGWLGLSLNMLFYFDLSNPTFTDNDQTVQKLFEHINTIEAPNLFLASSENLKSNSIISFKEFEMNKKQAILKWNKEEINEWLVKKGLYEWITFFEDSNGSALLGLYHMKNNNYSYFCQAIDDEIRNKNLKISLISKSKLFQVLDNLFLE